MRTMQMLGPSATAIVIPNPPHVRGRRDSVPLRPSRRWRGEVRWGVFVMRFLHSLQPNRRWIQVMVASCLCLCGGCGNREAVPLSSARPVTELRSNLPDRDIALARDLLRRGAVLLDVRTPEEYAREHLPNAILMPESDIAARLGEVGALAGNDLDRPILVYCAAGVRAARAKEILLRAGYRNVSNTGGLADWKDADRSGGSDRAPSSAEREEGAGGIYRDC